MNNDRTGNAGTLATMSPSERSKIAHNESDFLAHQAAEARAAMDRTRRAMTEHAKTLVDPRVWVGQYPWIAMGTATVLGFVTASAVTPTREETLKERMQSLFPEAPPPPAAAPAPTPAPAPSGRSTLLQGVGGPLFDAVKAALVTTISSAITAKPPPTSEAAGERAEQQPVSMA